MGDNVIVTGATGFLGSCLVNRLLLTSDKAVYCLVRPMRNTDARARLLKALEASADASGVLEGVKNQLARVHVLEGDIKQESWGLSPERLGELKAAGIAAVWHNAASLRYEDAYKEQIVAHNLQGTINSLDVAAALGVASFNYMSTAYVAGKRSGDIPEQAYDADSQENNWYEHSKRRAEDAVLERGATLGFHVRIFRPSIVIGDSRTFDGTTTTGFYGFINAISRVETWVKDRIPQYFEHNPLRIYCPEETTLNLVPVDLVVDEAIEIAAKDATNTFFNLTNPKSISTKLVVVAVRELFPDIDIQLCAELSQLNSVDAIFRSQLMFYNPYLMSDKNFLRARDAQDGFCERYLFSKDDLVAYGSKYLERSRKNLSRATAASKKVMSKLTPCEIACRHGGKLRYYKIGQGPLVALVNAYGVSLESWRWVIERLAERYTVVTWECRGLFSMDGLDAGFTFGVEEHGRDLLEIIAHERADSVRIVSWCSGAKPATWVANHVPGLVESICFIAPNLTPFCYDESSKTKWDVEISSIAQTLLENPQIAEPYLAYIKSYLTDAAYMTDYSQDSSPERITNVLGMFNKEHKDLVLQPFVNVDTLRNYAKTVKEFYQYDIVKPMEQLRMPLLFMVSENDSIANPKQAEVMAGRLENSRHLSFPATSHFLVLENGRDVAEKLDQFLAFQA